MSAYIPTNVISITDGQIYLVDDLFKSGVRPAVDVGISVSRVGGAAQIKAMKSVSGTLKLDLAQFRELEAFATFGSELDAVSKAQLERGERLVELLKQGLHAPMAVEDQVVSIFAGTNGYLDDIPSSDVGRFETELLDYMRTRKADLMATIRDKGSLPEGDALAGPSTTSRPTSTDRIAELRAERERAQRRPTRVESDSMAGGQERILRRRIKSVQSTKKITRAMELIAASRIVKAQARVQAAQPYADGITEVVRRSAGRRAPVRTIRCSCRAETRAGSARSWSPPTAGLCGAYNSSVIRAAEGDINSQQAQGRETAIVTVGRKPEGYFRFRGYPISGAFGGFTQNPRYEDAREVAAAVIGAFQARRARSRAAHLHQVHLRRSPGSRDRAVAAACRRVEVAATAAGDHAARAERGLRVRAGARRDPRRAAPALRGSAHLRGAARTRRRRSTRPASAR